MKDRILNLLMMAAVAAALGFSLLRGGGEAYEPSLPFSTAFTAAPAAVQSPSPAVLYRRERQERRRQERETLLSLSGGADTEAEMRALAEKQLLEMARNDETELAVEAALAARGYAEGLCVARQEEVTVFLPQALTAQEAALLMDLTREVSGLPAENIRLTGY